MLLRGEKLKHIGHDVATKLSTRCGQGNRKEKKRLSKINRCSEFQRWRLMGRFWEGGEENDVRASCPIQPQTYFCCSENKGIKSRSTKIKSANNKYWIISPCLVLD